MSIDRQMFSRWFQDSRQSRKSRASQSSRFQMTSSRGYLQYVPCNGTFSCKHSLTTEDRSEQCQNTGRTFERPGGAFDVERSEGVRESFETRK